LAFTPPNTQGVLVDTQAPQVTQAAGPANGSYRAGQNLDFTLTFSEAVTVTGAPSLALTVGSQARSAQYVSGSGSSALVFRYTVQAGDQDTDGVQVASPVALNGGSIADAAGNAAQLTFTPPNTQGVLVDTQAPQVAQAAGPANGTYGAGQNLDFTLTFSEAVTVTGAPSLPLTVGSQARSAQYVSGSGTNALVFRYTVQ